jgi:hypothetical protein
LVRATRFVLLAQRQRVRLSSLSTVTGTVTVEEAQGIAAQHAADLVEGTGDGGAEDASPSGHRRSRLIRSAAVSASESLTGRPSVNCSSSFQRDRRPSAAEREAGLLEDLEFTPDHADGAAQFPRGALDSDARRMIDELDELPLPSELVPARHVRKYDTQAISLCAPMCPY